MRLGIGLGVTTLVVLTGCEEVIDLDPIDERTPVEARIRPKPISGGTLAVMSDGLAVAADPDRDRIHVVDIEGRRVRHTIALESGDEPGRVVQGSEDLAHVVLRGFGGIATIDRSTGTVVSRRSLCPDPRGLAYDPYPAVLYVACADGTLVQLEETGGEIERTMLEPDLRDVVLVDGFVNVSLFRAAAVLDEDGIRRLEAPSNESVGAGVAWRTRIDNDGNVAMIHQLSSKEPVPIDLDPGDVGDGGDGGGGGHPYGGGGGFCNPSISSMALTTFTDHGVQTTSIPDARLAVDVAFKPAAEWVALAMPGVEEGRPSVALMSSSEGGCSLVENHHDPNDQITAVDFSSNGILVMQSREPARLLVQSNLPNGRVDVIDLEGESRFDTGHEIFHRSTESGLSCASCHPEGTDDGHVWVFEGLGKRRTQSLDIGLAESAPFHWDGDMDDLSVLIEEVLAHRMGGKRQSPQRSQSFTTWMFAQQRPVADAGLDEPALVTRGAELFASFDCVRCHTGAELGGTLTTPIRDNEFQVPSLHRVSLRPPFMHDGRSPTLEHAVRDMMESTTTELATQADIDALSAYMRTL